MSSDLTRTSPFPSEFPVDFDTAVGGASNRDLSGKGSLLVRWEEPRFLFQGRPRGGLFGSGKGPAELPFRSDQIWNVLVKGHGVQFSTDRGKSGADHRPFVFTCASAAEAEMIAALLPAGKDPDFVARDQFMDQLERLPDAGSGLSSVTNILVGANIAVFGMMGALGAGWIQVESMEPYVRYGANNGAVTTDGQWWRLFTCMFMHFGVVHLLLNLWALFQAGPLVERLFGRWLFTLLYFGSGLMGSLATLYWNGDTKWSAGASGAVFGVYGALLGYLAREKQSMPAAVFRPMLKSTLIFAGYNLVFGAVHPNIDNAAHLGGLLGGVGLGWICALPLEPTTRAQLRPKRGRTGLLVAIGVIAVGIALAPRYN